MKSFEWWDRKVKIKILKQFVTKFTNFLSLQRSLTYSEPEPELDQVDKSGSRLYVSHDKKFVIKSMDSEAVAELHSVLRSYHEVHHVF